MLTDHAKRECEVQGTTSHRMSVEPGSLPGLVTPLVLVLAPTQPNRENTMSNNTPTIVLSTDDKTAKPLVQTIRDAVNGTGKYSAYVKAHNVTRETVKDHAYALAVLAYPNDKPVQKVDGTRTRFGNAVQAAGYGLRTALGKGEGTPKVALITALGAKSTRDEVIAAWEAAQK